MKGCVACLEKKGWLKDENKEEVTDHPSFSVMNSLSQSFTTKLWGCAHNTYGRKGKLQLPNAVRLVVPPDMIFIWLERLYHAGTRCFLHK